MARILAILAATMAYAVARYHLAQDVPWSRLPLWTTNKAVSLTALILLAQAYLCPPGERALARRLGLAGFALSVAHSLVSWALLDPSYYAKLYDSGRLTGPGEASVWFGVIALAALAAPAAASFPVVSQRLNPAQWKRTQRLGYLALALTAAHVAALGAKGWIQPRTWPAWLPPITLLSFLVALWPIARRLCRREQSRA